MTTPVETLIDAGVTGNTTTDQTNVNAALEYLRANRLPVYSPVSGIVALIIANMIGQLAALQAEYDAYVLAHP